MIKTTRYLICVLLAGVLLSGCVAKQKAEPLSSVTTLPFCQKNFSQEFVKTTKSEILTILTRAEIEKCWEPAFLAAVGTKVSLPESQLVKGLNHFNHHQQQRVFDQLVEQYLLDLVSDKISYGKDQQNLLEAYSRRTIRNAHSQESPQLRLVQQVCWRLDRPLYVRLFE